MQYHLGHIRYDQKVVKVVNRKGEGQPHVNLIPWCGGPAKDIVEEQLIKSNT